MVDFLSYLTSFRMLVPLGLVSLPLLVLLAVVVSTFVNSPARSEADEHGAAPLEAPPVPSTPPVTALPPESV